MKKLKKIMLFVAVLSSLPVSVCNAVNTATIPTQLVTCERGEIRLRFYKDKAGTAPDSVFTAPDSVFYAGKEQQLYVAAVSSTTGGQCTFSRLSGNKITLKAHKPGGADSVLVKYADQDTVVADKNGRDLILEYSDDGFYRLPGFTYNDAGEFILSASGKMKSQPIIPQMLFRVPAMLSRVIPGLRHPRMLFT